MRRVFLPTLMFASFFLAAPAAFPADPEVVVLWPNGAPGALGGAPEDIPKYTVYPAASPTRTGVLVCPGGGYQGLAMDHEGLQVAKWLNGYGVSAFVLQYRLGPRYHHPIEMNDAKRAMRMIRAHAREYGLDPNRIGIWGFSAGGHLASTVSTHADNGDLAAPDAVDKFPSRADFAILAYPVISFGVFAHQGSVHNLLGPEPDPTLIEELSNEKHVTQQTPPTFLFATSDDPVVPVENSVLYYQALRKANVPVEMHLYEHGAHGVGLAFNDPILSTWPRFLAEWMRSHGWLSKPQK